MDFDIGIKLYREYQLPKLEQRLNSLKRTGQPVLEAESSHVGLWGQTSRRPPELPRSDTVSPRKESNQSSVTWNRDRPPKLYGGPITNEPMQAEDVYEMDPGLDVASSGQSVTSYEPSTY